MQNEIPHLIASQDKFKNSKKIILNQWMGYTSPKEILKLHNIDVDFFLEEYASGVFDYFIGVISGEREVGNCPIMQELLLYLKNREISADELFEICSHFRRSMIDFSYDASLTSKELIDEISYIFDKNFRGILKHYTDTIFRKLIDARQEALQAGQAKEYFLSNMSHEIRTPLNAILGFVNLLLDDELSKKQRNSLEIILNSGENLLSIINDILDFSKLRSGEFTIDPQIFSLHEEISHTMELFVASATSKNITITSFIDPMIPKEIFADALRIKQILSNFLSNAIKFTPNHGIISVIATCHNKMLKISVRDSGIGIEAKDIKNIFTAFAHAQYSEFKNSGGTGLGLSICHQLTEHMGGHIGVESELQKGSTFWVEIPIEVHSYQCQVFTDIQEFQKLKMVVYAEDKKTSFQHESFIRYAKIFEMNVEVVDTLDGEFDVAIFVHEEINQQLKNKIKNSDKHSIALMSKQYDEYEKYTHINAICFPLYCSKIHVAFSELLYPETYIPYSKKVSQRFMGHILVAEDNEANQELIKILLQKYGLSFDVAANGLEAVALFKRNTYDLILMDEQMPRMDGNEAIKAILEYEKQKSLRHTPISALTANVIKGARERGLLSGFDAFLGKPIVIKELERVFLTYLKTDSKERVENESLQKEQKQIQGLNIKKLADELLLSNDELAMLVSLYIKKMCKILPEFKNAIEAKEYKKIALHAHSIKGSSANFRIEILQNTASDMEMKAKNEESDYDYFSGYAIIAQRVNEIKIF
ncbi:MAG: hybrid sensor histidine kinase/response regulator [Sulfurimonas sp. GWF2_37_8]|nr:MAG: hybrid sensor histidine kinase/response regulator [Sulfurimonas sp. GWF2_37_8]